MWLTLQVEAGFLCSFNASWMLRLSGGFITAFCSADQGEKSGGLGGVKGGQNSLGFKRLCQENLNNI